MTYKCDNLIVVDVAFDSFRQKVYRKLGAETYLDHLYTTNNLLQISVSMILNFFSLRLLAIKRIRVNVFVNKINARRKIHLKINVF
jgi:hypothetical protein